MTTTANRTQERKSTPQYEYNGKYKEKEERETKKES